MATKDYEVLHGIRLPDGQVLRDGVIELDEDDEATQKFLDYEAIRLVPERKSARAQKQQSPGPNEGVDATQSLTVPEEAGREELLANGYDTDDKVHAASDDELLAIDGIGPKTLEKIRAAL